MTTLAHGLRRLIFTSVIVNPFGGLPFHFFDGFLWCAEAFSLMESWLLLLGAFDFDVRSQTTYCPSFLPVLWFQLLHPF